MITFAYIEDYIEVMAGLREITASGHSPGPLSIFGVSSAAPISLARYDVNIVNSMSQQTAGGTGYTDRQGELALKLVAKYQRQFAAKGVDVGPSVDKPAYRNPLRIIDRTKILYTEGDKLILRFPYDNKLVPKITSAAKEGKGRFHFDREAKYWELALTEHNVNWAHVFAQENGFIITDEVNNYMQLIVDSEKQEYKIELTMVGNEVTITNAEDSLHKYINENLGGLSVDNLVKLVDYAPVLGYTVHPDIGQAMQMEFNSVVSGIMINKESHIERLADTDPDASLAADLLKYAEVTNRWPICIYEPDVSFKLRDLMSQHLEPGELLDASKRQSSAEVDLTGVKCVYFTKLKRTWNHPVPILVSTNAMLYGVEKQAMLYAAEKVVYYTPTTLNREATTIAGEAINKR